MSYVLVAVLSAVGLLFAVSATSKVRRRSAWREFVASVRELRLLPAPSVVPVAAAVAVVEVLVAVAATTGVVTALLGRPLALAGSVALAPAAALMAVLTTGIVLALRRGSTSRCACFGLGSPLGSAHVVRNGVILAAVLAGLAALATGPVAASSPGAVVVCLAAGALAGLCVTRLDDLIDLFSSGPHRA